MIHNYSNFININNTNVLNEGALGRPEILYWNSQFEKIQDIVWTEISTYRYSADKYIIQFKAGDDKYDYYGIVVDWSDKSNEEYYLENPKPVIEKIKNEFWKSPQTYIKNLKYEPTVFGDLSHIKDAEKYNI